MALRTTSLIRRNMSSSPHFTSADDPRSLPTPLVLADGDELVGWVRNPPPSEHALVVFTKRAVAVVAEGKPAWISLKDIVRYDMPTDKLTAPGITVHTIDGQHFVPMPGRFGPHGKFGDVFSFAMILHVIVGLRNDGTLEIP